MVSSFHQIDAYGLTLFLFSSKLWGLNFWHLVYLQFNMPFVVLMMCL
jgi:hypothetical protein